LNQEKGDDSLELGASHKRHWFLSEVLIKGVRYDVVRVSVLTPSTVTRRSISFSWQSG